VHWTVIPDGELGVNKSQHSYSIDEMLAVVRRLPAMTPQAGELPVNGYATFKDQWIGWLKEYDGPGYYGRADGKRDARWIYQHLNNGNMIVWLNEAAGESQSSVEAAIRNMQQFQPKQTRAKIARLHFSWERVADLLFKATQVVDVPRPDNTDIVDEHFRPFVRALGNLVITFAICENELLRLVAAMLGNDELEAVALLKDQNNAKNRITALVAGLSLSAFERDELVSAIDQFWQDKQTRNRLIHDDWYPDLFGSGSVATRGITRTKKPELIFGDRAVSEVWALAERFQAYDHLFSHRSAVLSRKDD